MKGKPFLSPMAIDAARKFDQLSPAKQAAVERFIRVVKEGDPARIERERVKILDRFGIPH